jgi:predicted ATPase
MSHDSAALPSVATLFGELIELDTRARSNRLVELDRSAPAVARELRALLDVDADAGDFLGVHELTAPTAAESPVDVSGDIAPSRYRLLRELGRGGMGTVWLARDERLDREVALKFLRLAQQDAAPARRASRSRFLLEARAAARIEHPNVASVYDVGGTRDDRLYIAMAHCAGGSLGQRLHSGPIDPAFAMRVATGVADGLGAAHRHGIIHRDLKPANVLFDTTDTPRLADFGIALLPGTALTQSGVIVGTLGYVAPEQLRGARPDHRADLWAFGVTLYEVLTGRRPFDGDSHASVMHAVLYGTAVPVSALRPDVPAALNALIAELLAKDPAHRPASAEAISERLRAIARGDRHVAMTERAATQMANSAVPEHLTQLIGREDDLRELSDRMLRSRLVTITGAGGSGKTRTAAEIARRHGAEYAGKRVTWVDLTPVEVGELVIVQIAAALRAPEIGGPDTRMDSVVRTIGDAPHLLLLDNCEHLVTATSTTAQQLLQRCPRLQILATSREALNVAGEAIWLIPALRPDDACRLFEQRAADANPTVEWTDEARKTVRAICARLDGIPLAIELAAARVRLLSVEQIATRLDDAFRLLTGGHRDAVPRHRTLRAAMEWSHSLLSASERALLRRLSVFAGSFAMDAAEAICGDRDDRPASSADLLPAEEVLHTLSSLVDKSLVTLDTDGYDLRYRLLETVRQYGAEQLHAAGETEDYEAAHAAYFVTFAEALEPKMLNHELSSHLMRQLVRDNDNLMSAIAWCTSGDAQQLDRAALGLRLAGALFWYWNSATTWLGTGRYAEAVEFVRRALERGAHEPPLLRARAWHTLGLLGLGSGAWNEGRIAQERARTLAQSCGAVELDGWAATFLGAVLLMTGDVSGATNVLNESRASIPSHPPTMLRGMNGSWVAVAARARGDIALARQTLEAGIELFRGLRLPFGLAHDAALLAGILLEEGRTEEAGPLLRTSMEINLDLRPSWGMALSLEGLSALAHARRDHDIAIRVLGAVDAWRERTGVVNPTFYTLSRDGRIADARAVLGSAFESSYAYGRTLAPAEAAALVLDATPRDGALAS